MGQHIGEHNRGCVTVGMSSQFDLPSGLVALDSPREIPKVNPKESCGESEGCCQTENILQSFFALHLSCEYRKSFLHWRSYLKKLRNSWEYSVTSSLDCTVRSNVSREMPFPLLPCWCYTSMTLVTVPSKQHSSLQLNDLHTFDTEKDSLGVSWKWTHQRRALPGAWCSYSAECRNEMSSSNTVKKQIWHFVVLEKQLLLTRLWRQQSVKRVKWTQTLWALTLVLPLLCLCKFWQIQSSNKSRKRQNCQSLRHQYPGENNRNFWKQGQ